MLARPAERIEDVLERLSPDDRALLELSLRRGVSDDDIAALLRVHREHVEQRREVALERLAEDLDADSRAEAAALIGQSWRAAGEPATGEPSRLRRRVTDLPPSPHVRRRARRRGGLIGLATLAAAGGALAMALSSSGDRPAGSPKPAPANPAARGASQKAALAPIAPSGTASGSARLRGSRLELSVSGLPPGSYAVWLFDDVSNARLVARLEGPRAKLRAALPKGFERYRFVDVSRDPADGNPNHSGESVLRAPFARLLGR